MQKSKFTTTDEYISSFPKNVRDQLEELRKTIKRAAPEAAEVISYNMPAFKFHGILLYFAAHTAHIGFYPGNASVISIFNDDLADYETSKGTIKFPMGKAIPANLLEKIVRYRVEENQERARLKGKKIK